MHVQFVSGSEIGAAERKRIRSHVMKGKNAGKPRVARKPLMHRSINTSTQLVKSTGPEYYDDLDPTQRAAIERLFWNDLTIASFPETICPDITKYVYHRMWIISKALYPPEFCVPVNLSQYTWFIYMLEDKAYFHCLLAIGESFVWQTNDLSGPRMSSATALKHISKAYRLLNERLSSRDACSDKAIAVVTMLAIYHRMRHDQELGLVHFKGLLGMIELRGGLRKLTSENRVLAQKPWRIALEFALQDGAEVAYGLHEVPGSVTVTTTATPPAPAPAPALAPSPHVPDHAKTSPSIQFPRTRSPVADTSIANLDPRLQSYLSSISSFTTLLSSMSPLSSQSTSSELTTKLTSETSSKTAVKPKLRSNDYTDAVCIRLHRLLSYASLAPSSRCDLNPLNNLVHLTLVSVMTTLMPEYGQNQAKYTLLASLMRTAVKGYSEMAERDDELVLWAGFVGCATVLSESDGVWLLPLASESRARLGISAWEDMRKVVCRFAWISVLCDKPALKLWNAINGGGRAEQGSASRIQ